MFVKGLVLLLLAVVVAESSRRPFRRFPAFFPQRVSQESASSLGGAQVGIYGHTRGRPAFVRSRFPAFFPRVGGAEEYATSLGGAPVGLYNRGQRQGRRLVRARLPLRQRGGDSEYAASLGGADVGLYRRNGGYRRADVSGASLGKAPVGIYGRE